MFQSFLIKYGEIGIKGKNRYLFEDMLVSQISHSLKRVEGEFFVHKQQGRIYVECQKEFDFDETVEALQTVFGIVGICPVVHAEDKGLEELEKEVLAYIAEVHPQKNQTFKVNARRARKNYPMTSMELNAALGEKIL